MKFEKFLSRFYLLCIIFLVVLPFLYICLEFTRFVINGEINLGLIFETVMRLGRNIVLSLKISLMVILLNLSITLPTVFYNLNKRNFSAPDLFLIFFPVFIPAIMLGFIFVLFFGELSSIFSDSILKFVFALCVGTFYLLLFLVTSAVNDNIRKLYQSSLILGASRLLAFRKVVIPVLEPSLIRGTLLTFAVVFNEFVVSSFIAPPGSQPAILIIFNQIKWFGLKASTITSVFLFQLSNIFTLFSIIIIMKTSIKFQARMT